MQFLLSLYLAAVLKPFEYFVQGGFCHTAAILGFSLHQVHQSKEINVAFEEGSFVFSYCYLFLLLIKNGSQLHFSLLF